MLQNIDTLQRDHFVALEEMSHDFNVFFITFENSEHPLREDILSRPKGLRFYLNKLLNKRFQPSSIYPKQSSSHLCIMSV